MIIRNILIQPLKLTLVELAERLKNYKIKKQLQKSLPLKMNRIAITLFGWLYCTLMFVLRFEAVE